MIDWYLLRSKPNKEEFVLQQLNLRDITAYYPCIEAESVNPRSRKIKPYFPGYLFIHADLDRMGTSVLKWIPGTVGLVSFGNELASMADDLLQAIRNYIDQINKARANPNQEFMPGNQVQIQSGPFAAYQAIFDSYAPGHERVHGLLKMLQERQINLDLARAAVGYVNTYQSGNERTDTHLFVSSKRHEYML